MAAAMDGKAVRQVPYGIYARFNRFLERYLPAGLYPRALIIVIAPVILLQAIMATVILDHHWEKVSRILSRSIAGEMAFVIASYEVSPKTPEAIANLQAFASEHLNLELQLQSGASLPTPLPSRRFSMLDHQLTTYIERSVGKPFWIDTAQSDLLDARVQVEPDVVFRFLTSQNRAYAANTPLFLWWLGGSSLVLLLVAIVFLRNQIRPILQLADAAQSFGMGRDVEEFRPRGAAEVKQAAAAFLKMKERIERHVEQRTAMLAGVSHDLRTVLTRFKLELALLDDGPQVQALKGDVDEMQRMLEGYIAFVRGDGDERSNEVDIAAFLDDVARGLERSGQDIAVDVERPLFASVKSDALKRCIGNLVHNAARHAGTVRLGASLRGSHLMFTVDDDGPGIPLEEREAVFRPFVRLDDARNQDAGGGGLGLTIARDIAHSHGGSVRLDDSPLGGLRAVVTIPV
ncbi:MAG TPA: ATP-binding protein [Aestuariivirgaceae bacterium]|nr:ATP-binding protein [Aestuariivirgaceae bacterium]